MSIRSHCSWQQVKEENARDLSLAFLLYRENMEVKQINMNVQPISFGMIVPQVNYNKEPSFGYSNELKTLFKRGLLPSVKVDAAGNKLTKKNVTLDHIIPKSKGGESITENYMLAEKKFNSDRGADPLAKWTTMEGLIKYLNQFIGVRVCKFIGNEYVASVLKTLERANELGL